ncbi:MAG: TylF/MycF/NovP-related O-methyltransferase [Arcobacter sp.]|uniref:TylF/MycF/NovP-related O-methyltransferase n=1 Tax=Arcobacter sp. TaxID=1872629 RepID=UPI003B0034EE
MDLFGYETDKKFDYENGYYLTSDIDRIGKMISHYTLYNMIKDLPGDVIETGVFKGNSFIRWLTFRNLLENEDSRSVIGFDTFESFPNTDYENDKEYRERFINNAGNKSISTTELEKVLNYKKLRNFELIKGDILETLPTYFEKNPHLKVSLLHIDTDIYEPAIVALSEIWDRIVKGGIVIFDDYGTFPGETKAVDDFFRDKNVEIKKLTFSQKIPVYIKKNSF